MGSGPYMIDAFQNIFVAARAKLNISKNVRLYDASQNSFVTQLRRAGMPLNGISKLVEQSSEKITEAVYNHAEDVNIENKRLAISKLSLKKQVETVDTHSTEKVSL